ncbi:MAG TPA: ParB/RepB/Spo0J family partition protein [Caulobacteraceae bacterium]|jgi:ParB family chromosome partitioning protein|nr:ParB/RepB/Spo0J family partition protein [Caulobacteraceae bacterium]
MTERRGLGRGLSALLDEATAAGEGATAGNREIPIEQIHRNAAQPRMDFDDDELNLLAASIREKGVLQPILVRPSPERPGEYQIVAGERRWRAAQTAGLTTVPVTLRELDDLETLEIAIIENVQRADLNPVEEASAYRALMDRFGHTQEDVARAVGKSRSHVANCVRLLDLPERVVFLLRSHQLSAGHARAVASAADPTALANQVVEQGLSVRAAEALARRAQEVVPAPERMRDEDAPRKDADTRALEEDLARTLGLVVEIAHRRGGGELTIRYKTLEQLDDLCRRLTRG